ncbi:alpha/beta hydrolase [Ramlibacter alkalitolerans]|uniref:Dienelactone hydrolase family protein n=1 Tax=Ramlibacter alkalitolerans TaxID=2039631 RepID=A0ABS1JVL3_9BURK|nr:dienelactone hydrolase family protein [Ramlibacter alkalitolerans]MBL0428247.1 dienelactone hydrolase family protein [Ramlibacter alkalitolerans]
MLDIIEAESGPDPTATILILHGLGADGNDFVPIAQELDLERLGPVRFIFPHAPEMPVTINNGYRMRAWYDILGFEADAAQDETGLRRSQQLVEALLKREKERGIPAHRIVLGGFSQGCAVSLLTGVRHPERLGGIMGLSGYLPLADRSEAERSSASLQTPIFLAHGTHDDVIALERAEASRDALQALGYQVEWHEYLMGHAVTPQEIEELNAWLLRVLSAG